MKLNIRDFINNLSFTFLANIISMLISILMIILVPKILGVEEYGYWQLFGFYTSYVGFIQLGWCDGVYLRYGGYEYNRLDKPLFVSQFWLLSIFYIIVSIMFFLCLISINLSIGKLDIIFYTLISGFLTTPRGLLFYILQGTNKIKEFTKLVLVEKILYLILMIILLVVKIQNFKMYILADLIAKLVSLLFSVILCKDIVFGSLVDIKVSLLEAVENIRVGVKLMFSNIASNLIIGIVRFGIENKWSISVFGKVSLSISISNLLMIFIRAIGVIMFPILKRAKLDILPKLYSILRTCIMSALLGCLVLYYPGKLILSDWLPQYQDSLQYMAILLPICIFECKMAMLIDTYLKTLRKEKMILKVNLITVLVSIFVTFIVVYIFNNLILTIFSILLLIALRSLIAEILLAHYLNITVTADIILELAMVLIFILSNILLNSWYSVFVYFFAYLIYLYIKKKDIFYTFEYFKNFTNK